MVVVLVSVHFCPVPWAAAAALLFGSRRLLPRAVGTAGAYFALAGASLSLTTALLLPRLYYKIEITRV